MARHARKAPANGQPHPDCATIPQYTTKQRQHVAHAVACTLQVWGLTARFHQNKAGPPEWETWNGPCCDHHSPSWTNSQSVPLLAPLALHVEQVEN